MQKKRSILPFLIFVLLIVLIAGAFLIGYHLKSATQRYDLNTFFGVLQDADIAIMVDNVLLEDQAFYDNDEIYLSFDTVQEYICERFFFDEELQQVIYVTPEGPQFLSEGVRIEGDRRSISLDMLLKYAQISCTAYQQPHRLIIKTQSKELTYADVKSDAQIRYRAGIKSLILTDVDEGAKLEVLDTVDDWTHVISEDGCIGYIKSRYLSESYTDVNMLANSDQVYTSYNSSEKICLAWHQMSNASGNATLNDRIANAKGINVISPTWFYLSDNAGNIISLADQDYVDTCHRLGIEVWALFENFTYDADVYEALAYYSHRQNMISNIVSECLRYGIDGINVDFEGLPERAGQGFIEFIRELSIKCHENGLVLSVDNYVPYNFNSFYYRAEQAVFADYVIVMSYDEHLNEETGAGSVASLEYVDYAISTMLKEVPKNKLINGIPFYTRLWIETLKTDQELAAENANADYTPYSLSWQTLGIAETKSFIEAHGVTTEWDEKLGQYYAEVSEEGSTYKLWIEDERSLEEKLKKVQSYDLAGIAAWKLGFETNSVWDVVISYYPE